MRDHAYPQPGGAPGDICSITDRPKQIGVALHKCQSWLIWLYLRRLLDAVNSNVHLLCRLNDAVEQIANDLMAIRRHPDRLAFLNKGANHPRPNMRLASAWRALNRKYSAFDYAGNSKRGIEAKLAVTLDPLTANTGR